MTTIFTLSMHDDQMTAIMKIVKEKGRTRSALIREAIIKFLLNEELPAVENKDDKKQHDALLGRDAGHRVIPGAAGE